MHRVANEIWRALEPKLHALAKQPEEQKLDAPPADGGVSVSEAVKAARSAVERVIAGAEGAVDGASKTAAKRADRHSRREHARLGIKLSDAEPGMQRLVSRWRKENVSRITGMVDDQLGKIERLLEEGDGMYAETLAKEIRRQVEDVSISRAEMIARDQVLTLNSQITQERQTSAGIEQYVWTTSNDERVREEHRELEGKTFSWDDPPSVGHPGEDYLCRCIAFPVLPELDKDDPVPKLPEPPSPSTGTLDGGDEVTFTAHPNAQQYETTVMVDAAALERAWQLDEEYYIPPGGGGAEIGGRREAFESFLEKDKPIQASRVNFDPKTGKAEFTDGRHRFSVLRDKGADRVAITIPKRAARKLPESFGAKPLRQRR